MISISIGLIVGLIMGLTGAGGALIAIPLFMNLLEVTLKEATILSLIAVILGTSLNLMGQLKKVNKNALILGFVGTISNYVSLPLKVMIPELAIAGLLSALAFYSLWGIWSGGEKSKAGPEGYGSLTGLVLIGLLLGLVTTVTGLGGGVILIPLLIKITRMTYEDAVPTSLATIFIISLTSLLLQTAKGTMMIPLSHIGLMAGGTLASVGLIKLILKKIDAKRLLLIRKIVFTSVTIYSVGSVFLKTL